jgi:alkanesulfonate monooxygenase SsuD/methylene tetrahydromethanopterin reductase-like flavin-dependent oxidoreductase (luciferase family)
MKIGIALAWPDDAEGIRVEVASQARQADAAGIDSIWTADHLFQYHVTGKPVTAPMLEAYATLAFVAGMTEHVTVGALVTCATYRPAGLLLKAVSTLDVLTGGRVVLGLGAGWYEDEARGLGVPFAPRNDRFAILEETLRLADQMWEDDEVPFHGEQLDLERPLNRPRLARRPPILIGGSGERRTLRLVAESADACNLFDLDPPFALDIPHKLGVLHRHCQVVGRNPAEIEITVLRNVDLEQPGSAEALRRRATELAGLGVSHLILTGPKFEWGSTFERLLDLVPDLHAIEPVALG